MTNYRFFVFPQVPAVPVVFAVSMLAALMGLTAPLSSVQAQGLKSSSQLRLPLPAARDSASTSAPANATANQRQADFIVAVVNSEPITNSEVRTRLLRAEQQLSQQGAPMPPRSELTRQVLERLITDKAQLQLAKESGVRADDNAVEGAVQTVARQNQITVEELRRRLRADGIAYSQFQSDLRDELLVSRLRQREVEPKVNITEQEIDQFLRDQDGSAGTASLELNLAQVLVAVAENASAEQVAALQAKAQQVAERARAGVEFAALVDEFSASARADGGQMGLRSADRYPPLFVEATRNLRTGGIAGPLRSGAGFHVLKVIEKKQAGMSTAAIAQTRARHILLQVTPQQSEAAAVEKLTAFKRRLQTGQADFAALARENSTDGSAKQGGDLGWTNPGQFVPEFEKSMNGLAINEVSEPLVSRFGVHLIQVTERREARMTPREQRDAARGVLREKKMEEAYLIWAQDVRGRAYVEYREAPQ